MVLRWVSSGMGAPFIYYSAGGLVRCRFRRSAVDDRINSLIKGCAAGVKPPARRAGGTRRGRRQQWQVPGMPARAWPFKRSS